MTEEKFNQFYKKVVSENSDDMEKSRKDAQEENRRNKFMLLLILLINVILNYGVYKLTDEIARENVEFIFIMSMIVYTVIKTRGGKSKIEKYTMDFKTRIIRAMIKSFGEQLEYTPKDGVLSMEYKEAEFERYDRYNAEDLIKGTLKNNCKFEMSEVLTESEHTDSDGNVKYSTIFSGLFAKMETPKPFNTLLYIRNDIKDQNFFNRLFFWKLPFDKLRIQLDSPEFEKIFDVYASDKIIAMQLLTADIMQDLIQFYNELEIPYELTIKENHIYIRFWCGEMFETAKLKKFSLDRDTLYRYYKMVDFTIEISDKIINLLNETQYN